MCTYPLRQHRYKHTWSLPKCPVLHLCITSTTTKILQKRFFSKMPSLTYVHTLYNNTNKNTKACFPNSKSYMCTYGPYQHKHKQKCLFPKLPILHLYIPSTTTKSQTQRIVSKRTSLTCVNILYSNKNINTKACFPKWPVLHVYIPSTTTET